MYTFYSYVLYMKLLLLNYTLTSEIKIRNVNKKLSSISSFKANLIKNNI